MNKKNIVAIGIVLVSVIALIVIIRTPVQREQEVVISEENQTAEKVYAFVCPNGETVQAMFQDDMALVMLPGGSPQVLMIGQSASGARYVNQDESLVFWNKGNTAMVEEGGVVTYSDCVTSE